MTTCTTRRRTPGLHRCPGARVLSPDCAGITWLLATVLTNGEGQKSHESIEFSLSSPSTSAMHPISAAFPGGAEERAPSCGEASSSGRSTRSPKGPIVEFAKVLAVFIFHLPPSETPSSSFISHLTSLIFWTDEASPEDPSLVIPVEHILLGPALLTS